MLCQLSYGRSLNVCSARWDSNPQHSVSQLHVVAVSVFQVESPTRYELVYSAWQANALTRLSYRDIEMV